MAGLTQPQADFVVGVSKGTGLDPRVVVAWLEAEGADAPNGTGHFNYLNVKPNLQGRSYSGVPIAVSAGGFEQFASVKDAVVETVNRIKQPFAGPIRAAVGKTPADQIRGIHLSGWDANGYGRNGETLGAIFAGIFTPAALHTPAQGSSGAAMIAATAGTGSAQLSRGESIATGASVAALIAAGPEILSGAAAVAAGAGRAAKRGAPAAASVATKAAEATAAAGAVGALTDWVGAKAPIALLYVVLTLAAFGLIYLGLKRTTAAAPGPAGYLRGLRAPKEEIPF